MSSRRDSVQGPGEAEGSWLSCRQFAAVTAFVALLAALVVWTTVAMPDPVDFLLPALVSSAAADSRPVASEEAP